MIASAPSERQVNAIVDGIEEELSKQGLKPVRREGRSEGRWVLLDYAQVIVHVQHEEDRVFYALDRLWKDCPSVDLQLEEALRFPIDAVLLDNMDIATLKKAVALVDGRVLTEASGGVNLQTVRQIAETGVDLISVGALTHSASRLDLALEWR